MKLFKMKMHKMDSKPQAHTCDKSSVLQNYSPCAHNGSSIMPTHLAPVPPHMAPVPPHLPPAPPHFRNARIRVDLDDEDLKLLSLVFGNESDAYANAEIICNDAPDEMRVQFIQLLSIIKTVLSHADTNTLHTETSESSNAHVEELRQRLRKGCNRYPSPGLGNGAEELYEKLYGDSALEFLEALWKAPKEPPIISRMIAFLSNLCQKGA